MPILYLHGFASSPLSQKAQFFRRHLENAGAEIEIPDLAAGDFAHLTLTGQLQIVEAAAKGRPVSLIGSSMGGYLAALYAARHPEVERLVLMAPAFGFAGRWHAWLGPEGVAKWRESGWLQVFHYGEKANCRLHYGLPEDSARYEGFPDFSQPALIFHGSHDDVVPVDLSQQFDSTHGNAELEVLQSGHDLLDALDYMAPKVLRFLGLTRSPA